MLESSDDFDVNNDNILVAIDPSGNALTLWEQSDGAPDGSTRKVYSRRYLSGQGWQPAVVVPGITAGTSTSAVEGKLLMDAAGNATWIRSNFETRRYNATDGWSAAFRPANSGSSTLTSILSSAVLDADGTVAILRLGSAGVLYNSLPSGGQWGDWVEVSRSTQSVADARLAVGTGGRATAIWRERNPGDNNYSVKASRLDPASGWSTPQTIESDFTNINTNSELAVAMDTAGNAIAVWAQGNSLYQNRYVAGTGWGSATQADVNGVESSFNARIQLAMTPDGRAVTTWNSGIFAVKAMQYAPATGWSAPIVVDAYSIRSGLGMDNDGNAMMVYSTAPGFPRPTTANQDVVSRRLKFGGDWSAVEAIETGVGDNNGVAFAMNASGKAVAVWNQNDTASSSSTRKSLFGNVAK